MDKYTRRVLATGAVLLGIAGLRAAEPPTPRPNHNDQQAALMRAKLASSQRVVEGLVSKDFEQIRRGATELDQICEATGWPASNDRVYAHHRTELRRQARKLVSMAEDRNLDGAAFTYMHSLTTCISCHQYCRDVLRIAEAPMNRVVPIPATEIEAREFQEGTVRR